MSESGRGVGPSPIFIIALPRTGSTLLYQLMATQFDVCYPSNLMMNYIQYFRLIARVGRYFGGCVPADGFTSRYGETSGWTNVSQGSRMWNRLFPEGMDYIGKGELNAEQRAKIREPVDFLQGVYGRPFLNKWQKHSLRTNALHEVFPEVTFVYLSRRLDHVAQSLLAGRRKLLGDENDWLSARPRDFVDRGQTPIRQVCEQAFLLERGVERDLASIDAACYRIDYDALCSDPDAFLDGFQNFYNSNHPSQPISRRRHDKLELSVKRKISVSEEEYAEIQHYLAELRDSGVAGLDRVDSAQEG